MIYPRFEFNQKTGGYFVECTPHRRFPDLKNLYLHLIDEWFLATQMTNRLFHNGFTLVMTSSPPGAKMAMQPVYKYWQPYEIWQSKFNLKRLAATILYIEKTDFGRCDYERAYVSRKFRKSAIAELEDRFRYYGRLERGCDGAFSHEVLAENLLARSL